MIRIDTDLPQLKLRTSEEKDIPIILGFIKELASYESLLHEVSATEEALKKYLFEEKVIEVILAEYNGKDVGFALFFYNFSTFLCKRGIYIEDLYIQPAMRGKGIGKALLKYLAQLAIERDCGRLEWACLDWNEKAIGFYKYLGAVPTDEWTGYRVTGKALNKLAGKN